MGLVPLLESVIKLKLVSVHEYAKKYIRTNPEEAIADVKKTLKAAVKRKQDGATCSICGQPIWAVGSAFSGLDGCFSCITGESDDSSDYEVY